jgi:PAS domain S-box-containing protein
MPAPSDDPNPMPMPNQPSRRSARERQKFLLLGVVLLAVGLFSAWDRYRDYQHIAAGGRHLVGAGAKKALLAPWWDQTLAHAVLFLLFAVGTSLALRALQRRQRAIERLARQRDEIERKGADRLALALRGADLGLWDLDLRSHHATVNERWTTMLGLPPDADAGTTGWQERVHPDDWPRDSAAQQAHVDGHTERYEAEYRMRHAQGHWIWILDRGQVLERDALGVPLRMLGTHMDITERMHSRLALERSEQNLATTLHSIGDAVIATDPEGIVVRMNPTAERLTGWSAAAAIGQPLAAVFRILNARTRQPLLDPVHHVISTGEVVGLANDTMLLARDGHAYQIADSAAPIRTPDGTVTGVVLVFSDVTGAYQVQQALRANERRLRSLLDNLHAGVIVHGPDSQVLDANPTACRIAGLTLAQMRGKTAADPAWQFLEEDHRPMALERYPVCRVLAGGAALQDMVLGVRRPGLPGSVWVLVNAYPTRDGEGRIEQVVVTFTEITELKQAEERIRAAQGDLQATLEAVPDLLFDVDRDGRFHDFRSPRSDLLYATPAQFMGRTVQEVMPAEAGAVMMAAIHQADASGHTSGVQYELELPSGRHWFELSVARKPVAAGEPARFIVLARDITERRRAELERQALERHLQEAQKIESIGTLAGGIAHDFNNILAAILGNVALAREDAEAGHPVTESLNQINRAGVRARHLVQQILAFSRHEPRGLASQPLRPVVVETLALLRATLPAGVRLDTVLPDTPVEVRGDSTQLQQVLMNLCTNAWHALPEQGGCIEVGFERISPGESLRQQLAELPAGDCVHLWVRDNGSGMDEATRLRIFDPFFTTKPVGRGTGLGLSVVHGIVRAHQGAIVIDTAPGQGTSFHLYFPLPEAAPAPAAAEPGFGSAAPGNGQHVIYIDDDDVMTVMVERLLRRAGFRVTVSTDPVAALALLHARPADFDAVVTDVNMPAISGIELAQQLARLRPELPVVISSGYLSDELRALATRAGVRAVMQKEHTFEELARLLHTLLAPAAAATS